MAKSKPEVVPMPMPDDPDNWARYGLCRHEGFGLFFHPTGERGPAREQRREAAKEICRRCPVIESCFEYSIENEEPYGVWGGMDEDERARFIADGSGPEKDVV